MLDIQPQTNKNCGGGCPPTSALTNTRAASQYINLYLYSYKANLGLRLKHTDKAFKNIFNSILDPQIKDAISLLIANAYSTWRVERGKFKETGILNHYYVSISRSNRDYKSQSFYFQNQYINAKSIRTAMDWLQKNGYIEYFKGFQYVDSGIGFWTRYRALPKLSLLFKIDRDLNNIKLNKLYTQNINPTVIVKDENKKLSKPTDINKYNSIQESINKINEEQSNHEIKLHSRYILSHINTLNISLQSIAGKKGSTSKEQRSVQNKINYLERLLLDVEEDGFIYLNNEYTAIFNNRDMTEGGRLFRASIQNLPKELRGYVLIDNEQVTELDYSAMHPRLLYNKFLQKEFPKGDFYEIPNIPRAEAKVAFQILLNATNEISAMRAINSERTKQKWTTKENAFCILDLMKMKHPELKDYFCSGIGLKLQNLDSQLAIDIMETFSEAGLAIAGIHDSFVIQQKHRDLLENVMVNSYMKIYGFKPELKEKRSESL